MKRLDKRVFCPQCGTIRICHSGSPYAVCPNGHGRLVRRFTKAEARQAFVASLPHARRIGPNKFTIDRRRGLFGYRNGSGRRPATPDTAVRPDEVIARHVTHSRVLVRLFARKAGRNRKDPDGPRPTRSSR